MSDEQKTTVIIGIGSTVLTDGAAPLEVIASIGRDAKITDRVALKILPAGGFDLLSEVEGFLRAIIIGTFPGGGKLPGSVVETVVDCISSEKDGISALPGDHGIEVSSVLSLGRRCGYVVPEKVILLGILGANVYCVGEQYSPEIAGAVKKVVKRVEALVAEWDNHHLSQETFVPSLSADV